MGHRTLVAARAMRIEQKGINTYSRFSPVPIGRRHCEVTRTATSAIARHWRLNSNTATRCHPPGGLSFQAELPGDPALCGVEVELQALELDPGATRGVSFTRGLKLYLEN